MADTPTPPDADRPPEQPAPKDVGSAYMDEDGVLEMSLRTESADGMIGEALLVIRPDDPRYAQMVQHLGGLKPGEGCAIPPFPAEGAA